MSLTCRSWTRPIALGRDVLLGVGPDNPRILPTTYLVTQALVTQAWREFRSWARAPRPRTLIPNRSGAPRAASGRDCHATFHLHRPTCRRLFRAACRHGCRAGTGLSE